MSDSSDHDESFGDSDDGYDENMNFVEIRPWVSASEKVTNKEIERTYMHPGRKTMQVQFSMRRDQFGTEKNLQDKANDANVVINAIEKTKIDYIRRRTNEIGLQAANSVADVESQTIWRKQENISIQVNVEQNPLTIQDDPSTTNPLDLATDDPYHVKFVKFLRESHILMEENLCSNETIDIFRNDFKLLTNKYRGESGAATELSIISEIKSFEFQECKKKRISCIRFQPKTEYFRKSVMATSFMENLSFDERIMISGKSYGSQILFWDYTDMHLFVPILILKSPLEITIFEFKPHDPNIIIAGAVNGQILLWDLNDFMNEERMNNKKKDHKMVEGGETPIIQPSLISSLPEPYSIPPVVPPEGFSRKITSSHKNAILSLNFLPRKIEVERKNRFQLIAKEDHSQKHQFATSSIDGQILFWDTRFSDGSRRRAGQPTKQKTELAPDYKNINWKALFSIQLYKQEGGPLGCSQIRFLEDQDDSLFFGTSDEGDIFQASFGVRRTDESSKGSILRKVWNSFKTYRPSVEFFISPFYDDIFLTIGEASFSIWKKDCEDPVFISPTIDKTLITCGFFSNVRPGVIYIGRADGVIDIWDFMDQSSIPTQQHPVVAIEISSICINDTKKELLAVGDSDGCLHLLRLPMNLTRALNGEKDLIYKFFSGEKESVEYFKKRFEYRTEVFRREQEEKEKENDAFNSRVVSKKRSDSDEFWDDEKMEEEYQQFVTQCFAEKKEEDKVEEEV